MLRSHSVLAALALFAPAAAAGLRFSEYVEGSGSNKALEIFNGTEAAVNLADWEVRVHFNGSPAPGLSTPLSGLLPAGEVFVLAASGADAAILAQADQTQGGNWFNGDDALALVHEGVLVDVIGQIGFDPGSQWGSGDASTADNTLRRLPSVTTGDADGSDAFDPSLQWLGFPLDTLDGLGLYPEPGLSPLRRSVPQIQGAGHVSPALGQLVQTSGLVTVRGVNGFWLQDPAGDGDVATSDGVFVFTAVAPAVAVGDVVEVTAQVAEFQPGGPATANLTVTELQGPTVVVLSRGNALPPPVVLGSPGLLPPTEIIDDDGLACFDPGSDGLDFHETLEGQRVRVHAALAVSPLNAFREVFVVTDGGAFASGLNARSGLTLGASDFNPERIQIQLEPWLLGGFAPELRPGDALGDIVGVVSYEFGNFEVKATQPFSVTPGDLQPEVAAPAAPHALSVASFNLHNLDPKLESLALVGSAADIDDDVGSGQFARLAAQIVVNLRAPDILALQEVQDGDGAEQTTLTDASLTWTTLVQAIVDAGGPAYEFRDIAPADDSSGGQPGGNIRVGFLFDPARVAIDEDSLVAIADPVLGDGDAFAGSRRPLFARFGARGRELVLIANHFSSKSGGTPLFGQVQPPVNGSVQKRIEQARVVHDVVAALLARNPAAQVLVLGDLNDFSFEAPLAVLKGRKPVLVDLSELLPAVERYGYLFEGNSQDLDHILASASLAGLADYDVVHVNAEFEGAPSDHDPVVTHVSFPTVCQEDLGFGGPGGATLSVCGDPLGPTGLATLQIGGLPAGAAGLLFFGLAADPVPTHGGIFVPFPPAGSIVLQDEDGDGQIASPLSGDLALAPLSLAIQFVHPDANQPKGFGFTNAVELDFPGP